jgi:hypothetical protein
MTSFLLFAAQGRGLGGAIYSGHFSRILGKDFGGGDLHWRTTPRHLAECLGRRRETQRKRKPPKLTSLLDSLLDTDSGSGAGGGA